MFAAVVAVTGSPVWAGSNPERRLVATLRRDGPDAVLARIHELGRRGMHPAELVGVVAAGSTPHTDRPQQLEKRLQSLRRVIANQELVLEERLDAGYSVDEEQAEIDGYRAEAAQLEAELGLEGSDAGFGGQRDNGRTDDAMEVHA